LFYGVFTTPSEEPWVYVIHSALKKAADDGQIRYEWVDNVGFAGDMERILREVAEKKKPAAFFGDAYGNEEAVRRVAADYPQIAFVMASELAPSANISVFIDQLDEPSYLCGLIAGGMTKSNVIGIVAGYPVPAVNRLLNTFIQGVHEVNPHAKVLVTFINNWFDPAAAKEAALAQIAAGADVLYGERFGVIEAAVERKVWVIGYEVDQNNLGPEYVLTSPVWDMTPTVEHVIQQVKSGAFKGEGLMEYSMMRKGGAKLAPFHGLESKIPPAILALVKQRQQEIEQGTFQFKVDESTPPGAVTKESKQ
jgi:basic membrane lipoprotein Med (substrate-binding protein (PBP1-ABC) superfamily)